MSKTIDVGNKKVLHAYVYPITGYARTISATNVGFTQSGSSLNFNFSIGNTESVQRDLYVNFLYFYTI